jgi:hypothetical protein
MLFPLCIMFLSARPCVPRSLLPSAPSMQRSLLPSVKLATQGAGSISDVAAREFVREFEQSGAGSGP